MFVGQKNIVNNYLTKSMSFFVFNELLFYQKYIIQVLKHLIKNIHYVIFIAIYLINQSTQFYAQILHPLRIWGIEECS